MSGYFDTCWTWSMKRTREDLSRRKVLLSSLAKTVASASGRRQPVALQRPPFARTQPAYLF